MYLDDGLGIEQNDEPCKAVVNQMKCDLIKSGFVPDQRIDKTFTSQINSLQNINC
jgi:hydroxymethylpyrimidine/phosphomethylpyrimidine kinase